MKKTWMLVFIATFIAGIGLRIALHNNEQQTPMTISSMPKLTGKSGEAINPFDQSDERIRIVYFGFTSCADVCPTSMAMLAGAYQEFDESSLQAFRPMLITIDPERDTAENTHKYAQYFDRHFEGFSGSESSIRAVAERYGVLYQKSELEGSSLGYTVDHSSFFYFIAPGGELISRVPHTVSPAPIIHEMKSLLTEYKLDIKH